MKKLLWLIFAVALSLPAFAEAKSMYVRPTATCPNNGDGTAYACAAGAGAAGAYSNLGGVAWGAGANQVSNGDTLYVCGFHGGGNWGTRTDNNLTPTTTAIIDGACPSDPGTILSANYVFTANWTGPDQYGVYVQSAVAGESVGGVSTMHIVQLVDGVPTRVPYIKTGVPDATWTNAGTFYHDTTGDILYLKPLGGVSPNSTTVYTTWIGAITFTNIAATVQNLTIMLSSDYCVQMNNGDGSKVINNTMKWCAGVAVRLENDSDNVIVRGNTITESGNGVYIESNTNANNSNYMLAENNTITDLNQTGYYTTGQATDGHAFGVQGGTGNIIRYNTMARIGGTCVTFYDFAAQTLQNSSFYGNSCTDVHDEGGLSRQEIGIEYSNFNTGHVANDVAGNVIFGNLVSDAVICLSTKSTTPTVGLPWLITNNTLAGCTTGFMFRDETDGNVGFRFINNIVSASTKNIDHVQNGSDTYAGVVINDNLYATDGATMFEWNGTQSAFTAWKTNSSQDAGSLQTDPLFISSTNFGLQATSPARRVGTTGYLCIGVAGLACYPDTPDLGAYPSGSGYPAATRTAR